MTDSRSELMALADRFAAVTVPRKMPSTYACDMTADERDQIVSALRLAASQPDREMVARKLYEIQPVNDRCDENGDPIPWNALASFCQELHYEQADAILSLLSGEVVQKSDSGASVELCECCNKNKAEHFMEWGEELCPECMAQAVAETDADSPGNTIPSDPAPGPDAMAAPVGEPFGWLYTTEGSTGVINYFSRDRCNEYMRNEPWTETALYRSVDKSGFDIDANNAEADREVAADVLNWLKARGLYDPRDYECEGPDVAELLTEHEENLQIAPAPAVGPDVREALDREEKYLLDHFGADCDIMPGDIEGAFHRIREAAALSRPVGDDPAPPAGGR